MARKRKNRGKKKHKAQVKINKPLKKKNKSGLSELEMWQLCSKISIATNMARVISY